VTSSGEAKREAPVQTELRPTFAETSRVNQSNCRYKLALVGFNPGEPAQTAPAPWRGMRDSLGAFGRVVNASGRKSG
jgi:hypothetical protein